VILVSKIGHTLGLKFVDVNAAPEQVEPIHAPLIRFFQNELWRCTATYSAQDIGNRSEEFKLAVNMGTGATQTMPI
jgi:hypothetical protein